LIVPSVLLAGKMPAMWLKNSNV